MPQPRTLRFPPPVVVDCHFLIFALTLTQDQRRTGRRPEAYQLVEAFEEGRFAWVWHEDIIGEYRDTIDWLIANHKPKAPTLDKRAANRLLRDVQAAGLYAPITDTCYEAARAVVMAPERPAEERDEDDVIYLAAADAADAVALLSNDKSLRNLKPPYRGIAVVSDLATLLRMVGP